MKDNIQTSIVAKPDVQLKQRRMDRQMNDIMQMVQDNSQLSKVAGILMNSVSNEPVFVQIVLNSDDESLMLFMIKNFATLECHCIALDQIDDRLWRMIYSRFGGNTQICMKTNTVIMSYENQLFTQLIMNGLVEEFDIMETNLSKEDGILIEDNNPSEVQKFRRIAKPSP